MGCKEFSHVTTVHNRACRFFLGLGMSAPEAAIQGDMGWPQPICHQWASISRLWCRLSKMPADRTNKKVFLYCSQMAGTKCHNWCYRVSKFFNDQGLRHLADVNRAAQCCTKLVVNLVKQILRNLQMTKWSQCVNRVTAKRGNGLNKLRIYKKFKDTFETESYVRTVMSRAHRSALAKFRCGVAPIRLETGRYEGLPVDQRLCPFCENCIEDEYHVILKCPQYDHIRLPLVAEAVNMNQTFNEPSLEMLYFILSNESPDFQRLSAKTLHTILQHRRSILYGTF